MSLPRGVFKVGTDVQQAQRGSRTASMKMSILYAEKTQEVKNGDGLNISGINLDYPVFLANINPSESTKGDIKDWLEPRLDIVFKQWLSCQKNQVLAEPGEIKTESLKRVIEKKKRKKERQKLLFDIETKKKELPKYKQKIVAKTKISKALKGIFKKRKR